MPRYDAFISYSHARDKPVAAALQAVLQRLGKPWYRRRALRVFRDDTSLAATPELWPAIEQALAQSRYLIVLASPQLAASPWCGRELAYWLAHKSRDTLLIALTDGELAWERAAGDFAWSAATPLPPLLKGALQGEPKWIDLRSHRAAPDARDAHLIDCGADLAAAIHGLPKEDLLSQEVREQKRALRLAWTAAVALVLLAAGAGWQWRQAAAARDRAERNYVAARESANEVLFGIVRKLREAQGVPPQTVREVLEIARKMMDQVAEADPDDPHLQRSRAGLFAAFVNVYLDLGDLDRAQEAAEQSLAIIRRLHALRPENFVWHGDLGISLEKLGNVRQARGDLAGALALYQESLGVRRALLRRFPGASVVAGYVAVSLSNIGEVQFAREQYAEALAAFTEALAIRRQLLAEKPDDPARRDDVAASLFAIGTVQQVAGEQAPALAAYAESAALDRARRAAPEPPAHVAVRLGISLERIGSLREQAGDKPGALAAYEECLAVRRAILAGAPDDLDRQFQLVIPLYQVAVRVKPARARALLAEALAILDRLAAAGRLAGEQQQWPQWFRQTLARLPAGDG